MESSFHTLLSSCFSDFLEMFLPDCAKRLVPSSLQPLSEESSPQNLVFQATIDSQEILFCLHIIPLEQTPEQLDAQLLADSLRLYNSHHKPVFPIALALEPGLRSAEPGHVRITIGQTVVLDFRYQLIDLSGLTMADFSKHQNPLSVVLMARAGSEQPDRPRFKLDCLRVLSTMHLDDKSQVLTSGFIDSCLPLDAAQETVFQSLLTASPTSEREGVEKIINLWALEGAKTGFEEGYKNGLEEGKAQGFPAGHAKGFEIGYAEGLREGEQLAYDAAVQKGREENHARGLEQGERQANQHGFAKGLLRGRQEAGLRILTGVLRRRFGDIPSSVIAKMALMSPENFEYLADDYFIIADLQDLQTWIKDHSL